MGPVLIPSKDAADHFQRLTEAARLEIEEFKSQNLVTWSDSHLGYVVPNQNILSFWNFMRVKIPEVEWSVRHFIQIFLATLVVDVRPSWSFPGVLVEWGDNKLEVVEPSATFDQMMTDPNFVHRWVRDFYAPSVERGLRCTESGK